MLGRYVSLGRDPIMPTTSGGNADFSSIWSRFFSSVMPTVDTMPVHEPDPEAEQIATLPVATEQIPLMPPQLSADERRQKLVEYNSKVYGIDLDTASLLVEVLEETENIFYNNRTDTGMMAETVDELPIEARERVVDIIREAERLGVPRQAIMDAGISKIDVEKYIDQDNVVSSYVSTDDMVDIQPAEEPKKMGMMTKAGIAAAIGLTALKMFKG